MPDDTPSYYQFPPDARQGWKSYPVRVRGPRPSKCHNSPTLLVQSKDRGYVTQNCAGCGAGDSLKSGEFESLDLWVACPHCRRPMEADLLQQVSGSNLRAANHGFACRTCFVFILLADLLPRWDEVCVRDEAVF